MRCTVALFAVWCALSCAAPKVRGTVDESCRSDRDCRYGLVCRDVPADGGAPKACVRETFGECRANDDCLSGTVCRDGACLYDCASDDDCKPGRRCTVGECRWIDEDRPCKSNTDCLSDEECANSTCRPALRMRCFRDADCIPSERCETGRCR